MIVSRLKPFTQLLLCLLPVGRLGCKPTDRVSWVERRQIPHLRVMGRNIRFLKTDLEPFRNRFKQEVEDGKTA
jgi:hypothetical protein